MKDSYKIGVTGGIGSGKSTVCKVIEVLGYPVYYSDQRARELTDTDQTVISAVTDAFGQNSYLDGKLDRTFIAGIVFSEPEKRELLNSIVHPVVRADFSDWAGKQDSKIVFQESALLFETGNYKSFDKSVLVTSPIELRISRLLKRDGISEEQIRTRMANQLPEEEKVKLADYIIENDNDNLVIPQVIAIIENIRKAIS